MRLRFPLFLVFFGLSAIMAAANEPDLSLFKNLKARSIGPAGMSGRITSIDVVENSPEIIYVGTASGGLWRSTSGGIEWEPLFDDQPVQSIGAVAIQQSNPSVIWAGTGEGNPRNSQSSGAGIYKSIDKGRTWKLLGLTRTKTIHRIIIHPTNPDVVWIGAMGSAWGDNSQRGVYKTENGGKSWKKVLYINESTGCADLVLDPSNPNKLIAAMWEYRRQPWFFTSGGEGSGLFVTHDGGNTWKERTNEHGLPKGNLGRMGLAIAPSNPDKVYALVENEEKYGLYASINGGFDWNLVSNQNVGNRPFYYADIYVDPANENRIYNLWSYVSLSEDGGKTFKTILNYAKGVHPDHHAFWVHPDNPNYVIEGNDGGLNISHDRGKNWRMVENLPLGQFYHINIDNDLPYNIYGGLQDNGSWIGPAYVWSNGQIRNHHWQELLFGDGFDVVPDLENSRYGYAMYQGGGVHRYDRYSGKTWLVRPGNEPNVKLRYNWNAAIADDPFSETGIYFGSQFVHHSSDNGQTWVKLSPDLTTNDPEKQKQANSGGLTIDATQAENYTTILSIAPSSLNQDRIWVGSDDGRLHLTTDRGKSWNDLYSGLKGAPEGGWIPQIEASKHDEKVAFVIVNNYRQNDWKPYAFMTRDGGAKWTRIANPSNVKGYCLSIVQDPVEPKLLFLGTENGLFVSFDYGETWQQWKHGVPSVSVMDLKIQERESDLVIGTFGRAVFVLDDISPLRSLCAEKREAFELFQPQVSYKASYQQASGIRFTAQAHFKGENRSRGCMMSFYADPSIMSKKEAEVVIMQGSDTVRDFTTKVDTGFNRIYWRHQTNGVAGPKNKLIKESNSKSTGMRVAPGEYEVFIKYGEVGDKQKLVVKADPRMGFDTEAYEKRAALYELHSAQKQAVARQVQQMHQLKHSIQKVSELLDASDSTHSDVKKMGKKLNDSLDALLEIVFLPQGFTGYDHVTVRLNDQLNRTEEYIFSSAGVPSQMALNAYEIEKKAVKQFLDQVNALLAKEAADYQKAVDGLELTLIKDWKEVQTED